MPVARFRKKPVVIEAIQLTWENWNDICEFVPRPWFKEGCYVKPDGTATNLFSVDYKMGLKMVTQNTKEFLAVEGDWIIQGVNGELYPCKPDIFEQTYERE